MVGVEVGGSNSSMQIRDGLWANVRGLVKLKREAGGLVWLLAWVCTYSTTSKVMAIAMFHTKSRIFYLYVSNYIYIFKFLKN